MLTIFGGGPVPAVAGERPAGKLGPVRASVAHEGASTGRRTYGWHSPTLGPNDSTIGSLSLLRDRSRQATRNDGYARGVVDRITSNLVGSGMQPLSRADDKDFARAAEALWLRWTDQSDADGQSDWYGQQELAVRCWFEAGECFLRRRDRRPEDGLAVPMQVQLLEPELCPAEYTTTARNGNRIRAGIEFDPIGRRVAYYFFAVRPGSFSDWDASDLRRIDAREVWHLYRPLRPGQIRGVPHLAPALVQLRDLDQFEDATLVRQKLANMFTAFLTRTSDGDDSLDYLTGQARESTGSDEDRPPLGLEPGLFQELSPGENVTFSDPPDAIQGYADFMRAQLLKACAAVGVPYEVLTGDLRNISDRTVRVVLGEFRRWVQQLQHNQLAFQVCRPVWSAWLDNVFRVQALPIPRAYLTDPEPWSRVQWQPQGWPYLHPVQDVEATQAAIRAGFTSRSAAVADQGYSADVIDAQQAADNDRADKLGLKYDSDSRQPKAQSAPKAPASADDTPPAPAQEAA